MAPSRARIAFVALIAAVWSLPATPVFAQDDRPTLRAREQPVEDEYYGTRVVDPYRWMEAPGSNELRQWLEVQAHQARAALDRIPARKALLARIHTLNQSTADVYGVTQAGGRYFYFLADPNRPVAQIMYREGIDGPARLVFDPATLKGASGHTGAGWFSPSRDGRYLVVGIVYGGAEEAGHLRVFDVDHTRFLKEDLPRVWGGVGGHASWLPDNRSFTYAQFPTLAAGQGPQERIMRSRALLHTLGRNRDGAGDKPLFGFVLIRHSTSPGSTSTLS